MLSPLGYYGGTTQTMPPKPGSPAIDAGSNALVPGGLHTDQRGLPRIAGARVDIGSVETAAAVPPPPTGGGDKGEDKGKGGSDKEGKGKDAKEKAKKKHKKPKRKG
jgi:hypothetical protein